MTMEVHRESSLVVAGSNAFEPQSFGSALEMCRTLVASGMFGQTKAEALLVKILAGRELGLTLMQSARSVYTFESKGKLVVGVSADAIVACANRHPNVERLECVYTDNTKATWEIKLRSRDHVNPFTYTIEMARIAGLAEKDVWKAHPAAMLRARAANACVKMHCPEATMGFVTTDELDEIRERNEPEPQRAVIEQTAAGHGPHPLVLEVRDAIDEVGRPLAYDQAAAIRNDVMERAVATKDVGVLTDIDKVLREAANIPIANEFTREMRSREPAFDEFRRMLEAAKDATQACEAWMDHGRHDNESDAKFAKDMLAFRVQSIDGRDDVKRTAKERLAWIGAEVANITALRAEAARIESDRAEVAQ